MTAETLTRRGYSLVPNTQGMAVTAGDPRSLLAVLDGRAVLIGGRPDWQDYALCLELDPESFFPLQDDGELCADVMKACHGCPVRRECLRFALANVKDYGPGRYGVWGATSPDQRIKLLRTFGTDIEAAVTSVLGDPLDTQRTAA
jgi:WhiB family transcriptional regulator, redox-sensing transcriptional regulator